MTITIFVGPEKLAYPIAAPRDAAAFAVRDELTKQGGTVNVFFGMKRISDRSGLEAIARIKTEVPNLQWEAVEFAPAFQNQFGVADGDRGYRLLELVNSNGTLQLKGSALEQFVTQSNHLGTRPLDLPSQVAAADLNTPEKQTT